MRSMEVFHIKLFNTPWHISHVEMLCRHILDTVNQFKFWWLSADEAWSADRSLVQLHVLWDSGTSLGAFTLLFMLRSLRRALAGGVAFGLTGGAAGGQSVLSAAQTRQNQLAAELGGTELILVPWRTTVPAVWTHTWLLYQCIFMFSHVVWWH